MEWSLGSFGDLRLDQGGCDPRTDGCAQDGMSEPALGHDPWAGWVVTVVANCKRVGFSPTRK